MDKNMKGTMTSTAFVVIATGPSYVQYAKNLVASIRGHLWFDPAVYLFTDNVQALQTVGKCFHISPRGYPNETLYRYHTILSKEHVLEQYDQLFYLDADMLFVKRVELEEIASDGLTATLHPGYFEEKTAGSTEKRRESTAFCIDNLFYYAGGFQGGNAKAYLAAAKVMAARINEDTEKGITAIWHDESHWNKLLADTPPAHALSPSFCYPEGYDGKYGWSAEQYPAKLVALDKHRRGNHPRLQ